MVGAQDGFRVPVLKTKIEDGNCLMTIKICGDQQNYVDVSRCEKLSTTFINRTIPLSSPNIVYLDISFTRCDELTTIFSNCIHLKVLNLSGLSLMSSHLEGIQQLRNLEVLSLRSSNIDNIVAIKELYCLRSLDLGCMKLKSIGDALTHKDRLEELLFDYTTFDDESLISDIVDNLPLLSQLKLLNITYSDLEPEFLNIKEILETPIYYESKSRRELFFRALVNNNVREAYFYISSGQDINAKIEKGDELWLTDIWIERCYHQKTRLQTPFFIFNPIQEEVDDIFTVYDYFPTGLHLALFFNAYECVQMLLANNADQEEEVYISDVLFEKTERILYEQYSIGSDPSAEGSNGKGSGKRTSAFLLTSSKSSKNLVTEGLESGLLHHRGTDDPDDPMNQQQNFLTKKIYSIKDYIHYLYQKNVHRFTENLIHQKVSNWKSICDKFKKRLLYLVETYDPNQSSERNATTTVQNLRGNDSFNVMTLEELDHRKTFAINMKFDATASSSSSMILSDVVSRPTTSEEMTRKQEKEVPIGHITLITPLESKSLADSGGNGGDSPAKSPSKLPRTVSFAAAPSISNIPPREEGNASTLAEIDFDNFNPSELPIMQAFQQQHQTASMTDSESAVRLQLSSKEEVTILPAKPKLFPWYDHGLVQKLVGPPKMYKTVDEEAVNKEKADEAENAMFNNWMQTTLPDTKPKTPVPTEPEKEKPKSNKRKSRLEQELAALESVVTDYKQKLAFQQHHKIVGKKNVSKELPKEIAVLGKKSYWLESRSRVIEETVTKREESEIYPPIEHKDLLTKKKIFLQNLKMRMDQKYQDSVAASLTKGGRK